MSLLEEIQSEAVDSHSDLASVLRKCKVLAARLGSQPLENWLMWESQGYPVGVELPGYRIMPLELRGDFAGIAGSGIRNAPIPSLAVPEDLRDQFTVFRCRQSVASIEQSLKDATGSFRVSFNELPVVLGPVYRGMNCIHAWGMLGSGHCVEVLNTVRNRILDFVLEIWKAEPTAGDIKGSGKLSTERVNQIFNTTVHGSAFVAGASQSGDMQMGDTYEAAQAGAMGPGAHAHDMTFQQIWNQNARNFDLNELAGELALLREALGNAASEPDHYIVIGKIVAAEQASAKGDGPKVMEYLRNAGNWALSTAEKIGIALTVAAIKAATGY